MSVTRTCNEWPLAYLTEHKTFATMKTIDFSVIDQMFAAITAANENDATIDALRPQVEQAVRELIRQRGLPRTFTGIIEYNGFKIRVQRPKSYTWHLNTQIQDDDLEYYKRLHDMYEQLQDDVKDARADLKRKAEKLAKKYPDSESIKHGFTVAIMA